LLSLRDFLSWCEQHARIPVPATDETIIDFLEERSRTIGPCSLKLRLSALNRLHGVCGAPIPGRSLAIRDFMTGFQRTEPDPDEARIRSCPVRAMRDYLALLHDGQRVFRKVQRFDVLCRAGIGRNASTKIVKHAVEAVGLDPSRFGAHSLRAGFVTGGYDADLREAEMMLQTRHASVDNLRRYRRKAHASQRNLTRRLGY